MHAVSPMRGMLCFPDGGQMNESQLEEAGRQELERIESYLGKSWEETEI
jgi:hypothetical protein